MFERPKFNSKSQQDKESVDNFITDLYCLAEYCEFGTLRDDLIRDRIVVGLKAENFLNSCNWIPS